MWILFNKIHLALSQYWDRIIIKIRKYVFHIFMYAHFQRKAINVQFMGDGCDLSKEQLVTI